MYVCTHMHPWTAIESVQSPKGGIRGSCELPPMVLGTKLGSSARATNTLKLLLRKSRFFVGERLQPDAGRKYSFPFLCLLCGSYLSVPT